MKKIVLILLLSALTVIGCESCSKETSFEQTAKGPAMISFKVNGVQKTYLNTGANIDGEYMAITGVGFYRDGNDMITEQINIVVKPSTPGFHKLTNDNAAILFSDKTRRAANIEDDPFSITWTDDNGLMNGTFQGLIYDAASQMDILISDGHIQNVSIN